MNLIDKVTIAIRDSFNSNDIDCRSLAIAALNVILSEQKYCSMCDNMITKLSLEECLK